MGREGDAWNIISGEWGGKADGNKGGKRPGGTNLWVMDRQWEGEGEG